MKLSSSCVVFVLLQQAILAVMSSDTAGTWSEWSAIGMCTAPCGVGAEGTQAWRRRCESGTVCIGPARINSLCRSWSPCVDNSKDSQKRKPSFPSPPNPTQKPSDLQTVPRRPVVTEATTTTTTTKSIAQSTTTATLPFIEGTWSEWSANGVCSASCGVGTMGTQEWTRHCVSMVPCFGSPIQIRSCVSMNPCLRANPIQPPIGVPESSVATETTTKTTITSTIGVSTTTDASETSIKWSEFSECSKTCGLGEQTRQCIGAKCPPGGVSDSRPCNVRVCVGNIWKAWSSWTACSASCGGGTRSRSRDCDGGACIGPVSERSFCLESVCPLPEVEYHTWIEWSSCSTTCGPGEQQRERLCSGDGCKGKPAFLTKTKRPCFNALCLPKRPSVVDFWSPWSKCDMPCGGGRRNRTRQCLKGNVCTNLELDEDLCNRDECPSNATNETNTGPWSDWSECSRSCALGETKRVRNCTGSGCSETEKEQTTSCNKALCRSTWQEWSQWSECSSTCGLGDRVRARVCYNRGCIGLPAERRFCTNPACPAV